MEQTHTNKQRSHYTTFHQLHHETTPLLLANAWNVRSAQLIEKGGFAAIATSSGAIAASLGYPDGEQIPFEALLYIVQRITACTTIPVSVDLERGYSDDPAELTRNVQQLIASGVAGINLEDAQGETVYLQKLAHIKRYLNETGQELFLNARTDAFLQKLPDPLETTLRRAALYRDAGADGLFVTGVSDTAVIRTITSSTSLPVNVVGTRTLSSIEELTASGVKRISMAGSLFGTTYGQLGKILQDVQTEMSLSPLF